jgi:hypothetical protein
LLACDHYHVIFTLPHDLNPLWLANVSVMTTLLFQAVHDTLRTLLGPMALKLRPDLIEGVERCLYFRFNVWPWQFIAKMDTKAVWNGLEKGQTLPVPCEKGNRSHASIYLRCLQHTLIQADTPY